MLVFRRVYLLEESERRSEELERVLESHARLMRGFSHDVRNPLGADRFYACFLRSGGIAFSRLWDMEPQVAPADNCSKPRRKGVL